MWAIRPASNPLNFRGLSQVCCSEFSMVKRNIFSQAGGKSSESEDAYFNTPGASKIGLPQSRVLYTVLRSPHIDKKSREQFFMEIKKKFVVMKAETHELRNKLFWLKRQRLFGAQCEIILSCKTTLDKEKLQKLLCK
ncbi:hypothetical protein P3X46_004380 [Hevea brasiliensis]|uniref:Small ribosomal subunit protein uS10 domain-containing protein n=1 Tax=Hevea brasiliensis TaxID=3981 RepID=A0ABQ9MZ22_HEVBR|nr:ribosomal protein S10, mitochondrial [Hevea brasiliensis]KAJ9184677.1 hypothetical protein P3X46_004380 [Hevea brasiliensis]